MLFPSQLISGIVDGILNPLHDTFLNMLGCISGPMVFFSVAWGIYGIGDATTLKKVGKKLLTGYIGTVFIVAVLFTFLCLPLFRPHITHSATGANELSAVLNMILGIIPKNIFSPFTEGNTLQIIFLSIVFGVAMLFLGKKTAAVATAVEQINCLVQYLIELISKLIPYFIFVVILDLIWSDSVPAIASTGKYLITGACCILITGIAILLVVALIMKVNPVRLARGGLSTLVIALTTASSSASFSANMKACRKSYGISDSVSSFGIPLGIVTFKPATTINFLTAALFFLPHFISLIFRFHGLL